MFVCDRIAVMSAGRLVQVFKRGEWTQQALLEAAFSGYLGTGANGVSQAALPKP
jgi:ribose transport system ATP-binding protein